MIFNYKLYKITWEDICSDSGWCDSEDFDKMMVSRCISIGFIYRKDKNYVWIFSSYEINDNGDINYGDRTVIPKSNIVSMEEING